MLARIIHGLVSFSLGSRLGLIFGDDGSFGAVRMSAGQTAPFPSPSAVLGTGMLLH